MVALRSVLLRKRPWVVTGLVVAIFAAVGVAGFHSHSHAHGDLRVIDGDGNVQTLGEWRLGSAEGGELPAIAAGELSFELSNADEIAHNFVLVRTDVAAEDLPTLNGRLDLDAAGEIVGEVEAVAPGGDGSRTFELPPGEYVLVCNIAGHHEGGMYYQLTVE